MADSRDVDAIVVGAGATDGVGERGCGCVGCGWMPACGATGIAYPLWGVIGC